MFYDAKSIANYFLELAAESGQRIDPIKIQKLVYYANGWYAGHTGGPLIDEPVEAWTHGPVIASLFHEFARFGVKPIQRMAMRVISHTLVAVEPPEDPTLRAFLRNIWDEYGTLSEAKLHRLTHHTNSPWWKVRQTAHGMKTADIPFDTILQHFEPLAKTVREEATQ